MWDDHVADVWQDSSGGSSLKIKTERWFESSIQRILSCSMHGRVSTLVGRCRVSLSPIQHTGQVHLLYSYECLENIQLMADSAWTIQNQRDTYLSILGWQLPILIRGNIIQ